MQTQHHHHHHRSSEASRVSLETQSKLTMATTIITLATLLLQSNLVVPMATAAPTIETLGRMSPGEAVGVGNNNNFIALDEAIGGASKCGSN